MEDTSGHELQLPKIGGWVIEREVGRGGMGVVYAAVSRVGGERRALKVIRPDRVSEAHELPDEWLLGFEREISVHQETRHPHVVRLYDVGHEAGLPYLVMEYCESGSLAARVERTGPIPAAEAVPLFLGVLDALHHIHTVRGTVHRDIKPHNILLSHGPDDAPVAKLADFGLAKAYETAGLSGLTSSREWAGTPAYMPVVQWANFKYAKPPVDVWATAASLYFVLTGQVPRLGTPSPSNLTPAAPVGERGVSIPERLAEVVDQALDETSEHGLRTAEAFSEALRSLDT